MTFVMSRNPYAYVRFLASLPACLDERKFLGRLDASSFTPAEFDEFAEAEWGEDEEVDVLKFCNWLRFCIDEIFAKMEERFNKKEKQHEGTEEEGSQEDDKGEGR